MLNGRRATFLRLVAAALRRRAVRMVRDRGGIAALEFAMILPFIILIYVGACELTQATMTSAKIETIASTIAQVASQQPTSTVGISSDASGTANATPPSTLSTIMSAATAILAPASTAPLRMTLSAVDIINNPAGKCCVAQVRWTYTQSGTLRPCGYLTQVSNATDPSPSTIAASVMPQAASLAPGLDGFARVSVLIADVSYTYTPPFSASWLTFHTFNRTTYMFPRGTEQVVVPGSGAMSATGSGQSGWICY